MASGPRQEQRPIHQDYIARVRYSNTLPAPTNAPKLLDIPGTGLAGGQYTSAGYATKLAKEQPLNIEADAELGMPIDLIGIPGIFDGDESAIMARPGPHKLHETDKLLLKPLSAIGKGAGAGAVSFLRRTEYTAAQGPQHFTSSTSKDLLRRNDSKRRKLSVNKEDPINIIRNLVKGFDVAYPRDAYKGEDNTTNIRGAAISHVEEKAWANSKHPTKPELELLDSYPVLPDPEALPSAGFYFVTKFAPGPLVAGDNYDARLDAAVLRPKENPQATEVYNQKMADWDESSGKPQPLPEEDYEYYLPLDASSVRGIKRKLNVNDPENEDEDLYADDFVNGQRGFKYARLRTYETYNQQGDRENVYNDSVALALHDPETTVGEVPGYKQRLQKGAYFYPVMQRTALRPKRRVGQMAFSQAPDEDQVDEINVTIADPDELVRAAVLERQAGLDPSIEVEAAAVVEAAA